MNLEFLDPLRLIHPVLIRAIFSVKPYYLKKYIITLFYSTQCDSRPLFSL